MKFKKSDYKSYFLAGDIGGTNSTLGIFGIKKGIAGLIVSFKFKSNEMKSPVNAVNEVLNYSKKNYKIQIKKACFGVAGIVSADGKNADITKLKWKLSSRDISKKTGLSQIIFINDFQAAGYGINAIKRKQFAIIKKGKKFPESNIIVIGAGTGLGKSLLVFDKQKKFYKPIASEAGHADFPAQTEEEFKLADFIKKYKKTKQDISYEQVLSGNGLSNIYLFLRKSGKFMDTNCTKEIDKSFFAPELISKYRKTDGTCRAAFKIFKRNYAKFARDMAIDGLSFGGVYISGGIAPKNREIFDGQFIKIFEQSYGRAHILKKMPIYLILDCNLGLIGAGFAGAKLLKQN